MSAQFMQPDAYAGDFLYVQGSLNSAMDDAYVQEQLADLPRARLIRIEGTNMEKVKRLKFEAV